MQIPLRYKFLGKTFSGGMGDVHIYRDCNLNRKVAIKVIQDRFFTARILDEVRAFKKVNSKHVVEIFDILQDSEGVAIVEEYLPGKELSCLGEGFHKELFLKTVFQLASGLHEIHVAGLIHRDIKPGNMKFDGEGFIKIFDFGLARQFGVDSNTRGFRGTPGYAAPELYQNDTIEFTPAVDVYAFGVTCLYYAMGSLPDDVRNLRPRNSKISPFGDLLAGALPNDLIKLFDQTLNYSPSNRPEMSEIKSLLERHLLFNKHRALLILDGVSHYLDSKNSNVKVSAGSKGKIAIRYDGLYFKVGSFEGDIMINNISAKEGMIMPGACVVSLGSSCEPQRVHMTFDISHPGVVL
jgi:serine/threonine-protein kinase